MIALPNRAMSTKGWRGFVGGGGELNFTAARGGNRITNVKERKNRSSKCGVKEIEKHWPATPNTDLE
jgi:hypothetical protein